MTIIKLKLSGLHLWVKYQSCDSWQWFNISEVEVSGIRGKLVLELILYTSVWW